MEKIVKQLLAVTFVLSLTLLFSCKKDDNVTSTRNTVVYKVTGTGLTSLRAAVVATDGKGGVETFTSLSGTSWNSKEYVFTGDLATATVQAIGSSANSTLNLQIWVNGELKAQGNSTGLALSATATYSL
jgi:hypothetical protein